MVDRGRIELPTPGCSVLRPGEDYRPPLDVIAMSPGSSGPSPPIPRGMTFAVAGKGRSERDHGGASSRGRDRRRLRGLAGVAGLRRSAYPVTKFWVGRLPRCWHGTRPSPPMFMTQTPVRPRLARGEHSDRRDDRQTRAALRLNRCSAKGRSRGMRSMVVSITLRITQSVGADPVSRRTVDLHPIGTTMTVLSATRRSP